MTNYDDDPLFEHVWGLIEDDYVYLEPEEIDHARSLLAESVSAEAHGNHDALTALFDYLGIPEDTAMFPWEDWAELYGESG